MGRWIIVSNRLPFSYDPQKKSLKPSSGGLVTALGGIKSKSPMIWIGAVTDQIPEDQLLSHQKPSMQYQPLYIPHTTYEHYYNNFCNDVLWPLLHYECEAVNYTQSAWETYKQVNQLFAQHILSIAKSDDIVWIHDFHLFLVPELLKKANPQLKIGFFLHVPFPSSEVYRQLPCRIEILRSLIHSDLVGFHDFSYLRHFASAIHNVLGVHNSMLEVIHNHHICKLGVYPVSIDTLDFIQKAESKITAEHLARYAASKGDSKFLLGVDRLDYTKGILLKLHAFRELLTQHPELVGKVQLIQIAVPSRIDVPEYAHLRDQVEMLVGQINGQFSTINYVPVKYIFSSVNIYELMALYRLSDILFVTSKRDGMNLVCLEYVTAQRDEDPGVVVLSEFTGAASTLSHATLINPNDISGTASALYQALHMPLEQRQKNNHIMLEFLKNYNASDWAGSFIKDPVTAAGRYEDRNN